MATTSGLLTFADLEKLPETEGFWYELHHGELVRVASARYEHYRIQYRVRRSMEAAAGDAGAVEIEMAFRALPEHEYRKADVAFVTRDRWEQIPRQGILQGAPE